MANYAKDPNRRHKVSVDGDGSIGFASESIIISGTGHRINLGGEDGVDEETAELVEQNMVPDPPKWGVIAGAVVALVLVLCVCANCIPEPKSSFPAENGRRPEGASNEAVLAAALGALTSCAETPVLKPENCPQRVGGWDSGSAEKVAWRLHGRPGDGAIVHYHGAEGRFHVLGTAVMTVSYERYGERYLELQVVHYWSRVEWTSGKAQVAEIRAFDNSPMPKIAKTEPKLTEDSVFHVVRSAFEKCVLSKRSPMSPECPLGDIPVRDDKARWKLNGNPLINARSSFDDVSGLIHVIGNYSVTVSHDVFLAGPSLQTESGKFDAVVAVDNQLPVVLRIRNPENQDLEHD